MRVRITRTAAMALFVALLAPLGVSAQTSSWSHTITPEPVQKQPPKRKGAPAAATPRNTAPAVPGVLVTPGKGAARNVKTAPAPASKLAPLAQSTEPPPKPDNDPAYTAFDLGKYLTALKLAEEAAAKGEPQAHTLIGRIYSEGLGVAQNQVTAAQWYAKAAELGDVEGALAVGTMLVQGNGVAKDVALGAKYLETAARKGNPLAVYNLALLFLSGEGKPENPIRAFQLMEYAAEQGLPAAQYDLGTLYATGTGTTANIFEAARWVGRAASAGLPDAEVEYGILLFKGHGVAADEVRGVYYFKTAAEKGNAVAQNRYARCLAHGAGVQMNIVEAVKWHLIAKAAGVEDQALDEIAKKLSQADRLKAEQAAFSWQEQSLLN